MALLVLNKYNISTITRALLQLYNQSSKSSFKKILEVFKFLLIISRANSKRIPSTS